jgi:hypothetical protein
MSMKPFDQAPARDRAITHVAAASPQVGIVPYISRRSGERDADMPLVVRKSGRGIGYADERAYDRDGHGILWVRTPSQPGKGRPQFGKVHSLRQRIAMAGLRCRICGGPADRNADGILWLIDAHPHDLRPGEEHTAQPPVRRSCAHRSRHACPHLQAAQVALRVRHFRSAGVSGILYRPGQPRPRVETATDLHFGDPRLPWFQASQLLLTLTDFTVVGLSG